MPDSDSADPTDPRLLQISPEDNVAVVTTTIEAGQSVTIAWILFLVAHGRTWSTWARATRDVLIWGTVVFTALSALVYVRRTRRLMDMPVRPPGGGQPG